MKKILLILVLLFLPSIVFAETPVSCPQFFFFKNIDIQDATLLCRTEYANFYSSNTKTTLLIAEHLNSTILSKCVPGRTNDFRPDLDLPQKGRAELADYNHSGYDRGHMAPAGDFCNPLAEHESFLLSNMIPQVPGNNRGIWKKLEELVRGAVLSKGELYIMTGPVFTNNSKKIGNSVSVPDKMFKIIIDPKTSKSLSYIIPNEDIKDLSLQPYVSTLDEIQKQTGITFK